MRTISITTVALLAALIGCGGKDKGAQEPEPAAEALGMEEQQGADEVARGEEEATAPEGSATETPQGAAGEMQEPTQGTSETIPSETPPGSGVAPTTGGTMPTGLRAEVEIKLLKTGASVGTIGFVEQGGTVTMSGKFAGLPPGPHGMHIHEKGDCSGRKASKAGQHLNPTGAKHGPPESPERHAGDLGNLTVDQDGNAVFDMSTDSLTVVSGADSVVDRALIIHARKDDGKTQPSGNSGDPIACGVIRRTEGQPVSVIVR